MCVDQAPNYVSVHYEIFEPIGQNYMKCYSQLRGLDISEEKFFDAKCHNETLYSDNYEYLCKVNHKKNKEHDHYRVLGLENLRIEANLGDIKKSYKKLAVKYHPDKNVYANDSIKDIFSTITYSFELLSDSKRRKAFDFVDPTLDDSIPIFNQENFFEVFEKCFNANKRWSRIKPLPNFGNLDTPISLVREFYSFWYNFESNRDFSYFDEEDSTNASCRDERRMIEKANKQKRIKKKQEEMQRISKIVDLAYFNDPRIKKWFDNEKNHKIAMKQIRMETIRKKKEEEVKQEQELFEQQRIESQRAAFELNEKINNEKKEKAIYKKQLTKEKKEFRQRISDLNYFCNLDEPAKIADVIKSIDYLLISISLDDLKVLNEQYSNIPKEQFLNVFNKQIERYSSINSTKSTEMAATSKIDKSVEKSKCRVWTIEETNVLIKSSLIYPVGTIERWNKIAQYVQLHTKSKEIINEKDIVEKIKELKKLNSCEKEKYNNNAYELTSKNVSSKVFHSSSTFCENNFKRPWTNEEQKIFEQALKTYPPSHALRWQVISETMKNRSSEECKARFEELVELIKNRKKAAANKGK